MQGSSNDVTENDDNSDQGENFDNILQIAGMPNVRTNEFVGLDQDLAVFATFETIEELMENKTEDELSEEEIDESVGETQNTPAVNIQTYSDVLNNFRAIQNFALMKNDDTLYEKTTNIVISLEKDICNKKTKQSLLTDFFKLN